MLNIGDHIIYSPTKGLSRWMYENRLHHGDIGVVVAIKPNANYETKFKRVSESISVTQWSLTKNIYRKATPIDLLKGRLHRLQRRRFYKMFPEYPSIQNLLKYHDILLHECVVLEKIHGTNVRIGMFEGEVFIGSRSKLIQHGEHYYEEYDGYGVRTWLHAKGYIDIVKQYPNTVFYGEFCGNGVQKTIQYRPDNERDFLVFDVIVDGKFLDWEEAKALTQKAGFNLVPEIARGKFSLEEVYQYSKSQSEWAKKFGVSCIGEGVIVKPLKDAFDRKRARLIFKAKHERFTEISNLAKKNQAKAAIVDGSFAVGQAFCTKARVENAIDKLRQRHAEITIANAQELMRIYSEDVQKDAADILPSEKKELKDFMRGAQSLVFKYFQEWLIQK